MSTVPARVFGIVATEAPMVVLFRRGPSKLTQMLTWNLETDEITPGQWIRGKVFIHRCDLSPDGQLLVAAISNYSADKNREAAEQYGLASYATSFWTAVSRPPYFTALALWFMGPSYNGGGIWLDAHTLGFNNQPYAADEAKPMGKGYRRIELHLGPSEDSGIWNRLLARRRWIAEKTSLFKRGYIASGARYKLFPGGQIRYRETSVRKRWLWNTHETWEMLESEGAVIRAFEDRMMGLVWIDVDPLGRVLIADEGRLYRWDDFPVGEPRLVADLNANTFESVAPPDDALLWP